MKTILQINSSLRGPRGESSQLTQHWVDSWLQENAAGRVIVRDLAQEPVPHLDDAMFSAFTTPVEQRTAEQAKRVAYSDGLIDELKSADAIVLGLPMYNFGVPSTLKAYFDHIARAGQTFKYTENGPVGLLADIPVTVLATRGGRHAGTPSDIETQYVKQFLGFIGLKNVTFIYAEGLNLGGENRDKAVAEAQATIQQRAA